MTYARTQGFRSRPRSRQSKDRCNSKLPPLRDNIKGIRSFLGHAGFYRRFIKDFSKIAFPLTKFLKKDTLLEFNDKCQNAFKILKEKIAYAPVIFRSYLVLSKTIVHTDHSALRHLFKKQDVKPCLIRWIMLLQEFDIEIKDRNGIENIVAGHLSRIENEETSDVSEVDDNFPGETLMQINTEDEPWFADYLASDIISKGMTYQQKHFFSQTSNTTSGRNPTSLKYVLTV
ncbi:reverse transcriptase domain-containing protein [Tanacetum coccineum]